MPLVAQLRLGSGPRYQVEQVPQIDAGLRQVDLHQLEDLIAWSEEEDVQLHARSLWMLMGAVVPGGRIGRAQRLGRGGGPSRCEMRVGRTPGVPPLGVNVFVLSAATVAIAKLRGVHRVVVDELFRGHYVLCQKIPYEPTVPGTRRSELADNVSISFKYMHNTIAFSKTIFSSSERKHVV